MNHEPHESPSSLDHLWVPRIVVKFPDGTPVPEDGEDKLPEDSDYTRLKEWLNDKYRLSIRPLFTLTPSRIRELVEETRDIDPDYYEHHRVDFLTFFYIEVVGQDPPSIRDELKREFQVLELVYLEGGPSAPPAVPDYQVYQVYEDPASHGVDAEFAWGIAGGNGDSIGFVDLEQGWVLDSNNVVDHPDLTPANITVIGTPIVAPMWIDHGMNTLGVIRAEENEFGCTGIAPKSKGRVISHWNAGSSGNPQFNTADRILAAIDVMMYGDVLVIEAQTPTALGSAPVEVEAAVFKIIRLATALGIIVVEPAGNGSKDLKVFSPSFDRAAWPPGDESADSFAIVVGAAIHPDFLPSGLTNRGTRVDCFAWGAGVWTTYATDYTSSYSGTSSASAIVAGAALCVQGAHVAATGSRLSPKQMRSVLIDPGGNPTSSANGTATDMIGVMPNLRGILTNVLALTPDVYARDFVGDTGVPHSGPISMSPDIVVLQASTPDPAMGEGSGNEDNVALSDQVQSGEGHRVYVRVRNRQPYSENNVKVTVYWSSPSTLITPNDWNEIGSAVIPYVPGGDQLVVSPPIQWPAAAVPGSGHYCFVAVVDGPGDPGPTAVDFLDFDRFMQFVRDNNNVTWRNFNVVDLSTPGLSTAPLELPFDAAGAWDRAWWMEIEVESQLPGEARLVLDAPLPVFGQREEDLALKLDKSSGRIQVSIAPGTMRLGKVLFPPGVKSKCRLIVNEPSRIIAEAPHDAHVRQLYYGHGNEPVEVGRVTWRFVAGTPPTAKYGSWRDLLRHLFRRHVLRIKEPA